MLFVGRIFYFFFTLRLHPRSPLFPYTMLFRSAVRWSTLFPVLRLAVRWSTLFPVLRLAVTGAAAALAVATAGIAGPLATIMGSRTGRVRAVFAPKLVAGFILPERKGPLNIPVDLVLQGTSSRFCSHIPENRASTLLWPTPGAVGRCIFFLLRQLAEFGRRKIYVDSGLSLDSDEFTFLDRKSVV